MSALCAARLHNRTSAIPPGHSRQLQSLGPSQFFQFFSGLRRQVLMNRHEVVSFPPGLREPPRQKLIKRLQCLQPPVLTRALHTGIAPVLRNGCRARSQTFAPRLGSRPKSDRFSLGRNGESGNSGEGGDTSASTFSSRDRFPFPASL
jgi:hypothetical protein